MNLIVLAVYIGLPLLFISLGLIFGKANENAHLRNIESREAACADVLITETRDYDTHVDEQAGASLVVGQAVIATDYVKTLLAQLRNIFGGEVKSFLTLVSRARREATLRMIEQAKQEGYNAICNVRLESADIGGNTRARGTPMAAVIASGTAYSRCRTSDRSASV